MALALHHCIYDPSEVETQNNTGICACPSPCYHLSILNGGHVFDKEYQVYISAH